MSVSGLQSQTLAYLAVFIATLNCPLPIAPKSQQEGYDNSVAIENPVRSTIMKVN